MTPDLIASSGERKAAIVELAPPDGDIASVSLMLLRLGTRWFAIDVHAVVEVALKGEVTRVPTAPHHIMGITSLRGRLVTVVSMEQMLGGEGLLSRENPVTLPRLVVVRYGDYEIALVAETIHGIGHHAPPTSADDSDNEDDRGDPPLPEFVRYQFAWQEHRVALLDVRKLIVTAARLSRIDSTSELVEA
jgi:chemotaxis signal transduction protein